MQARAMPRVAWENRASFNRDHEALKAAFLLTSRKIEHLSLNTAGYQDVGLPAKGEGPLRADTEIDEGILAQPVRQVRCPQKLV